MYRVYSLARCYLKCIYYRFMVCWYMLVYVRCIYSQLISCRCSLSLFSLSNCINVLFDTSILSETMNVNKKIIIKKRVPLRAMKTFIRKEIITTINIQLGESLSSSDLWCSTHQYLVHVFWSPCQTQHLWLETSFRPDDHTDWGMAPPSYYLQSWGSLGLSEYLRILYLHEPP